MRGLSTLFDQSTHLVTFADDSYVSLAADSFDEAKTKVSSLLTSHDNFLKSIGMVTNVSKTEMIFFRKNTKDTPPKSITVNGEEIIPKDSIKVLGLQFDSDLSWKTHYSKLLNKTRVILAKMKFLSKYLDQNSMKKLITSHYFGAIYYGSPVWLNEITTSKSWQLLNVLHYKGIRTVCRDYRRAKSRVQLDEVLKRAKPKQWMKYSNCKMAIKLLQLGQAGPPMSRALQQNLYHNDRTGKSIVMDTSRLRIGRASLKNRLTCMRELQFNWMNISEDTLRIRLKEAFF